MTLHSQLRWINLITLISLLGVMIFTLVNLKMLSNEFAHYQNHQLTEKNLLQIKAAALAISRVDPVVDKTYDQLQAGDRKITGLYWMLGHQFPLHPCCNISARRSGIGSIICKDFWGLVASQPIVLPTP
jgi:hypothetical protein